jgi:hypothetical protein
VGATVNPLLLQGNNPTGANLGNPLAIQDFAQGGGINALIPGVGTSGSSPSTQINNPYTAGTGGAVPATAPSTATPATTSTSTPFPANAGAVPSGPIGAGSAPGSPGTGSNSTAFNMTPQGWQSLWNNLKKLYGTGVAGTLIQFLEGGAGFNQQALNNLFASLQPGIEQGQENIMEQFSAMGDRFGSPAAAGLANFESQVNLNEGQLETQMYETSINDYLSILEPAAGAAATKAASSPSTFDQILAGLQLGGTGLSALSQGISAANPGADTGILDSIAGGLGGL